MKKIIIGNWKTNMNKRNAQHFFEFMSQIPNNENDWIIFPPLILISFLTEEIKKYSNISIKNLGAQNFYCKNNGSYTGEISLEILKDFDIQYVLIGHGERRKIFNEDENIINKKLKEVFEMNINPIYIFGEKAKCEDENKLAKIIENQLRNELKDITSNEIDKMFFAYEPSWRIGGSNSIKVNELNLAYKIFKQALFEIYNKEFNDIKFIYGGSISEENYKEILNCSFVDGLLIGKLSLDYKKFTKVVLNE